jgi:hypothetical protein
MSRKKREPSNLTPAQLEAEIVAKREHRRQLKQVEQLDASLHNNRLVGVIAVNGASQETFKSNVDEYYTTKQGEKRTMWLPSANFLQGPDRGTGFARLAFFSEVRKHLRDFGGQAVLGFYDYEWKEKHHRSDGTSINHGTVSVRERVKEFANPTVEPRWAKFSSNLPAVILVGEGEENDLPTHVEHDSSLSHTLSHELSSMMIHLILSPDQTFSSVPSEGPAAIRRPEAPGFKNS